MTARRHNKIMKIVELGEPCRHQPRAQRGDSLCERQFFLYISRITISATYGDFLRRCYPVQVGSLRSQGI
jgi:hypothetical protein